MKKRVFKFKKLIIAIAVILVVVLIGVFVFTSTSGITYEKQVEKITQAAEKWAKDNYKHNDVCIISVKTLASDGYLSKKYTKKSKDKKVVSKGGVKLTRVIKTGEEGSFIFTYQEKMDNSKKCNEIK